MDVELGGARPHLGKRKLLGTRTWAVLSGVGVLAGTVGQAGIAGVSADAAATPQSSPPSTPAWPSEHASSTAWKTWAQVEQQSEQSTNWDQVFAADGCTLQDLQYVKMPADIVNPAAPQGINVTGARFVFECPQGVQPSVLTPATQVSPNGGQGDSNQSAHGADAVGRRGAHVSLASLHGHTKASLAAYALNGCSNITDGVECGGVNLAGQAFGSYQYLASGSVTGHESVSNDGPGTTGCWPGTFVAGTGDVTLSYPQSVGLVVPIYSSSTWDATFWQWTKSGYNDWGDVCGYN